jgi:hypothetical protein
MCARLRAQDERAAALGWSVSRSRRGARSYRDPRFDSLDQLSVLIAAEQQQETTAALSPAVAR